MKPIYFDNNATTMVAPEVTEAMIPFFKEYWGKPLQHAYLRRPGRQICG